MGHSAVHCTAVRCLLREARRATPPQGLHTLPIVAGRHRRPATIGLYARLTDWTTRLTAATVVAGPAQGVGAERRDTDSPPCGVGSKAPGTSGVGPCGPPSKRFPRSQ